MTTITAFQPPPNNLFSFQPTLDGLTCTATVWWNTDAQRFFVTVTAPDGSQIFNLPLIGSPPPITLASLSWSNGTATGMTSEPHGYAVLSTINLTVAGCEPNDFNGSFQCFVTGPSTFTYPLPDNPGPLPGSVSADVETSDNMATALGVASYDINLGGGYLKQSSLVFRDASLTFEVSP